VLVAKGLFTEPKVLIWMSPHEVLTLAQSLRSTPYERTGKGRKGDLTYSSELPEILGMSDRIYVMGRGRITGELSADQADQETVMKYAID